MLQAYFDESGTHGDQKGVTAIAGFVATEPVWSEVEGAWNKELAEWADSGVQTYHAKDCLWGYGEFEQIQQFLRHVIIYRLSNILGGADVQAVHAAVGNGEWETATDGEAQFLARYPKPYDFLFDNIVHDLRGWARNRTEGERIAPVFAVQDEYLDRSRMVFDAYLRQKSWRDCLTSISFSTPEQIAALQCADHLAFWLRYEWERPSKEKITLQNGGTVRALDNAVRKNGLLHQGGCWTYQSLRNAIAQFNRFGTLETP